jgi:uncharacterized BrkB/YihY/UPF0761 family membrane protein
MKELKINNEFLPSRCEICHQSDVFDPVNNCCLRCEKIEIIQSKNISSRNIKRNRTRVVIIATILTWVIACGVYANVSIKHILSMPDIESGYVSTWDFQLAMFFMFRFPPLLVILIIAVGLEYYFLGKAKTSFKFTK